MAKDLYKTSNVQVTRFFNNGFKFQVTWWGKESINHKVFDNRKQAFLFVKEVDDE